MRLLCSVTLAAGLASLAPHAAAAPPAREALAETDLTADANAALRYWRAWTLLREDERAWLQETISSTITDADFALDETGLANLEAERETIALLKEAGAMERCDFGVDYHKGPGALIPHLSAMRLSAYLLAIDARIAIDAGETERAVDSLVAGYALAEHSTQDRVLISALVGLSIYRLTDGVVQYADGVGALDGRARAGLCAAIDRFDREDPFRVLRSLQMEGRIMSDWWVRTARRGDFQELEGTLEGAVAGETAEDLLGPLRDAPSAKEAGRIAAEQVQPFLTYYGSIERAWRADDAAEKLRLLEAGVGRGDFGPFTQVMGAMLSKVHRNDVEAREQLEARRTALTCEP